MKIWVRDLLQDWDGAQTDTLRLRAPDCTISAFRLFARAPAADRCCDPKVGHVYALTQFSRRHPAWRTAYDMLAVSSLAFCIQVRARYQAHGLDCFGAE